MRILRKRFVFWASLTALSAWAAYDGYVTDASGRIALTSNRECVKSTHWNTGSAVAECDPTDKHRSALTIFGSPAHFYKGGAEISNQDKVRLARVAQEIKSLPPNRKLVIEGHADRSGSYNENRELSLVRAEVTKAVLIEKGVSPARIEIRAMGEAEPLTAINLCSGKEGDALIACLSPDRRADVYLR